MSRRVDVSPATQNNPDWTLGYADALDSIIEQLPPGSSFQKYIEGCESAFPSTILDRLQRLGRRPRYGPDRKTDSRWLDGPELHPLDFEWYFTPQTAEAVAASIGPHCNRILCLGTPTVALALSTTGRRSTLVDRNPLVVLRLAKSPAATILDPQILNLTEFSGFQPLHDAAVFDPPWYSDSLRLWLWHASRAVKPGGRLVFVLFKKLLRPSAAVEREQILSLVATIGELESIAAIVRYETPLFERVALQRTGLRGVSDWRTADLISVVVRRPMQARPVPQKEEVWDTFVIRNQVIKVRRTETRTLDEEPFLIQPVDGYGDFVYDSVSQRSPVRDQVSLWTSRNRIARVGKRGRLIKVLSELEGVADPRASLAKQAVLGLRDHERLSLRKVMDYL